MIQSGNWWCVDVIFLVVVVPQWSGGCDRQRSHLTLHVPNRWKDFFFSQILPFPLLPEAEWALVRIIKIDDIEWQRHDFCPQQEVSQDGLTKLSCHCYYVLHDCFTLLNWSQINSLYWIKVWCISLGTQGYCPLMEAVLCHGYVNVSDSYCTAVDFTLYFIECDVL